MDSITLPKSAEFRALLQKLGAAFDTGALILAGGQTLESADQLIGAGTVDLVAFGQLFISNPDLVARFKHRWPLTQPDRRTYYVGGAQATSITQRTQSKGALFLQRIRCSAIRSRVSAKRVGERSCPHYSKRLKLENACLPSPYTVISRP